MLEENRHGEGELYSEGEKIWWRRKDMMEEKRYGREEDIWWKRKTE
jgi:hypothetical protein